MKQFSLLLLFCTLFCNLPAVWAAQAGIYQHGSVVRMHMGDCYPAHRGFMTAFGPPAAPEIEETCPEYTLVSDDVVYIIVGRSSNQLIPLAQTIDFRLLKSELAVRVNDSRKESKFTIKDMIVRSEWERIQRQIDEPMRLPSVALRQAEH
jgi:hypothetical protein